MDVRTGTLDAEEFVGLVMAKAATVEEELLDDWFFFEPTSKGAIILCSVSRSTAPRCVLAVHLYDVLAGFLTFKLLKKRMNSIGFRLPTFMVRLLICELNCWLRVGGEIGVAVPRHDVRRRYLQLQRLA